MSNRRRATLTTRVKRRGQPAPPPPRRGPELPHLGPGVWWLPVLLAVTAEAGHLVAAFVEWPESTARGAYQAVAGGLLGLVAAAVATRTGRVAPGAGAAVAATGPVLWLGGLLLGAPPYRELPVPAATGIAVIEVALVGVLLGAWWAASRPEWAAPPG